MRVDLLNYIYCYLCILFGISYYRIQVYPHYWVGLCLALTACVTGGAMDVVVAGGSTRHRVSAAVLANWAAVSGLVGSLVYTVAEEVWGPFLLSASFSWHSWQSWQSVAIYIGGHFTKFTGQGSLIIKLNRAYTLPNRFSWLMVFLPQTTNQVRWGLVRGDVLYCQDWECRGWLPSPR